MRLPPFFVYVRLDRMTAKFHSAENNQGNRLLDIKHHFVGEMGTQKGRPHKKITTS